MQKIKIGDVLDVKRGASLSGDYYAKEGNLFCAYCCWRDNG